MVKCKYCDEEMLKSDGCKETKLVMNDGKEYDRIAVGDEYDLFEDVADEEFRCHDCNALYGHFHHSGCDCETCPKCHEQLLSCEC